VCLWFLTRNKSGRALGQGKSAAKAPQRRNRKSETLFIDARKLGTLVDRVHRELTEADIDKIVGAYHAWRGDKGSGTYADIPGFCKSATTEEIASHGYVLTPGRYVGAEAVEDDGEPFAEKMTRLVAELNQQFAESAKLEKTIKANLKELGYGG
jgi:type I restriction enzyme M protein